MKRVVLITVEVIAEETSSDAPVGSASFAIAIDGIAAV